MRKFLTVAALALTATMFAAPVQAQVHSSLFAAAEFYAGDLEAANVQPAIGGSIAYNFDLFTLGATSMYGIADRAHRVTSVDLGIQLGDGTARLVGSYGYGMADEPGNCKDQVQDEPNPDCENTWGRLSAGLGFQAKGVGLEVRVNDDAFTEGSRPFELRVSIN